MPPPWRCWRRTAARHRAAPRNSADPRRRDRAIAARIHPADSARRRPCQAERPGRHDQRPLVQRLRDGRPPHLRECRRADGGQTPNEIIGVLAHETGHIAGGHLSRAAPAARDGADPAAIIAMLLGAGAIAAGAAPAGAEIRPPRSWGRRNRSAARCCPTSARRRSRPTARREVPQRDRPVAEGHVRDLQALRRPGPVHGPKRRSVYVNASDAGRTRAALGALARTSPHWDKKDPPELQHRHDMMRAKLSASSIARLGRARYPFSDNSLPARYARAIATYRHADLRGAVAQIDALIQAQPNNPYFHELKGQALLEGGRPPRRSRRCGARSQLAPNPVADPGHARGRRSTPPTIPSMPTSRSACCARRSLREPEVPQGYAQLAMAYGRKGDLAEADLASAQAAFYRGDTRPRADSPHAPRPASRSARRAGSRPTTSPLSSHRRGSRTTLTRQGSDHAPFAHALPPPPDCGRGGRRAPATPRPSPTRSAARSSASSATI
jgi:hypothetical protein